MTAKQYSREDVERVISTEKRPLWCVAAYEWRKGFDIDREITLSYNHANEEQEARMNYCRNRCDGFGRTVLPYQIIGVARVIGFKALDNHGEKLIA